MLFLLSTLQQKRKTNLRNLRNYLQYACQHKKDENITQNFGY